MRKKILLHFCLLFVVGCQETDNDLIITNRNNKYEAKNLQYIEEEIGVKPFGNIYRSDGFTKGLKSEWIQIGFENNTNKIMGIWYWNSNNNKKEIVLLNEQQFNEGGVSRIYGKIMLNNTDYLFEIIEDRFMIINDNKVQTFDYENVEEYVL